MSWSSLTGRAGAVAAGPDAQGGQVGERPLEVEGGQRRVHVLRGLLQPGRGRGQSRSRGRGSGGGGRWCQELPGRSPQTMGDRMCPDLRAHPDHPTPSLRTQQDTYRNFSRTSPACPASRVRGELECCRVRARPAPSSLSCVESGEPPGGTWKVSVRGCP